MNKTDEMRDFEKLMEIEDRKTKPAKHCQSCGNQLGDTDAFKTCYDCYAENSRKGN
jgi:hypothetical protein